MAQGFKRTDLNTGYSDYNSSEYIAEVVASRIYKDIDKTLIHPVSGDLILATDLDAIFNSIKNIIMTARGTRPFFPEFGTAIPNLLFEPVGWPTAKQMEDEINAAIKKYEPRLTSFASVVEYVGEDRPHDYNISITFQPYFGGTVETNFILNRIR